MNVIVFGIGFLENSPSFRQFMAVTSLRCVGKRGILHTNTKCAKGISHITRGRTGQRRTRSVHCSILLFHSCIFAVITPSVSQRQEGSVEKPGNTGLRRSGCGSSQWFPLNRNIGRRRREFQGPTADHMSNMLKWTRVT